MRFSILFGGPAGTGPNVLTHILGEALVEHGNHVFYSRDYQSLIRGGNNFNVLTFSDEPVWSNDSEIDIIVALDENTIKIHKDKLKKSGFIITSRKENMYFAGRLFKMLCLDFKLLEKQLKKLSRFEENMKAAKEGYAEEKKEACKIREQKEDHYFMNGNQGISEGAVKSGLNIYYAYPMTPATPILSELAGKQNAKNFSTKNFGATKSETAPSRRESKDFVGKDLLVLELENEIAVVNAGVGSSIVGKKVMVGTSGGGFDLMTEGLSLCGIAEVPLVFYLAQRPGPATGAATYTSQGDLKMALNAGHGEFTRIVLAPGDPREAEELTNQAFYFSHKFKIPSIILGDKHLAESFYTLHKEAKITKSENITKLARFNSYERDEFGSGTENPKIIEKNVVERLKKKLNIEKEASKFEMYSIHGDSKSKNIIISWGSTKGAIIDAVKNLDVCFLQIRYLEPFPKEIKKYLEEKNVILIENNSTGQLGDLIAEKTGIFIPNNDRILRFDGRPFLADELRKEIERREK
ncbi:MAG: 2-oxoacid:acceptor oxidoreductase family protein [Candidatus Pacearchaeota archaeon]